ncbi:hypothetical protein Poly41_07520 [Novipirellula artificiosorum]|uniref:Uncharacterized protein n=1 Tax=Novipirellula artificiosorum TaxID=2528016 RepID=A0A5C6E156_9BACT|nr:hypothetical protein Poly41_07520 [Novipirellula artificiosorum]
MEIIIRNEFFTELVITEQSTAHALPTGGKKGTGVISKTTPVPFIEFETISEPPFSLLAAEGELTALGTPR